MDRNYNMRSLWTLKDNRKGFESKKLRFDKKCDIGTLKVLVDKCLGMVIKIWKDSKNSQAVSIKMTKDFEQVARRNCRE